MSTTLDRRNFLQQGAVSGACASLAVSTGRAAAQTDTNSKVVLGVMGLSRGRSLAVNFARRPGVEIKYVCDVDSNRAGAAAELVHGAVQKKPQAITDFRKILDDKAVDGLVCAAPNHWHAPATILACAAGKHVYVEKPCSHNPQEGEWMIQAARKHRRAVQVGTQRRSGPSAIEAVQKLHGGIIGRVYLSRAWYNSARGTIGNGQPADVPSQLDYELWQGPAPRTPYRSNVVHYNWHWRWHWGNGELGNNGVHTLDLCRWGLNVDFPTQVNSSGGRYHFRGDDQETPDTHAVAFTFPDDRQITWEGLSCNRHGGGFITFYGDGGTLELDSNGGYRVFNLGDKLIEEQESSRRGDTEHMDNFLAAIRNDKPMTLNTEIAEGHKSTLLCHLGNISQRVGRTLDCDSANGHIQNDDEAMSLWQRDYAPGWVPQV